MASIYDMASAIRQPDAGNLFKGIQAGQQMADQRRQNQARNALARLQQGDTSAMAELQQADPDAAMKWGEMQRAEETRNGLQGFFKPATGATNVVGVNSLAALANGQPAQPASYDFGGAMNYAAGRGDLNQAASLAQLRDKMQPQSSKYYGGDAQEVVGKDGQRRLIAMTEQGPVELPYQPVSKIEAPKAPQSRSLKIGGREVTQEWNGSQWTTVADAPREMPKPEKPDVLDLKERAQIEQSYRKEFNALNTAYNEIKRSRGNILSSLQQNSAAGDLAAATSLMKMLDPGSVVRESELGMAQNATGALDRVYNYAQMVANGQRLNPQQRKEYVLLSNELFANSEKEYKTRAGEYTRVAKDYGLKPENIVGSAAANNAPGWKSAGYANVLAAHADYKRGRDAAYKAGNMDLVRQIDAEARADGVIK